MKYRDHKGGFAESLETVIEINSFQELLAHLNKFYKPFGKEAEEIKFTHVGKDERIGWDTYYVLLRLMGEENFSVVGMSDGKLENKDHIYIATISGEPKKSCGLSYKHIFYDEAMDLYKS